MQTSKCALFIDCKNLPVSFLLQIISALEPFNVCFKKAYTKISTLWACAGFDGFAEINKINSKMIAHFGKDGG